MNVWLWPYALGGALLYLAIYWLASALGTDPTNRARVAAGLVTAIAFGVSLYYYLEDYRRYRQGEVAVFDAKCLVGNGRNALYVLNRDRRGIDSEVKLKILPLLLERPDGDRVPTQMKSAIVLRMTSYDYEVKTTNLDGLLCELSYKLNDLIEQNSDDRGRARILEAELRVQYNWPWGKKFELTTEGKILTCRNTP